MGLVRCGEDVIEVMMSLYIIEIMASLTAMGWLPWDGC